VSARTHSGLTPTEIARETRLPVNQVTSQLKRLSGLGYVRAANVRARSSWYSLAEPLYAIWHQMRFGRESRERMAWLVEFLKAWYSSREMLDETERLAVRFAELVKAGEKALAVETLDYRQYLTDAMDERFRASVTDRLVNDSLDADETDRVRGILRSDGLTQLPSATLKRLRENGLVTADQSESEDTRRRQWMAPLWKDLDPERLVDVLDPKGLPLHENPHLWLLRAAALHQLGRDEEAFEQIETCTRPIPDRALEALLKAEVLFSLCRYREAISALSQHADESGWKLQRQKCLARSHAMLGDFETAIAVCDAALAQQEDAKLRQLLGQFTQARLSFEEPQLLFGWLATTGAFAEARAIWDQKIRGTIRPGETGAIFRNWINARNLHFLRTLIRESKLDNELLPLSVAMDYLETGDRSPLEKLSAEVRPIAEEIVAELQKKLSQPEQPGRSMHIAHT
jgi:DNA-binding transcriptional ArsR family regulator